MNASISPPNTLTTTIHNWKHSLCVSVTAGCNLIDVYCNSHTNINAHVFTMYKHTNDSETLFVMFGYSVPEFASTYMLTFTVSLIAALCMY